MLRRLWLWLRGYCPGGPFGLWVQRGHVVESIVIEWEADPIIEGMTPENFLEWYRSTKDQ